MKNIAKGFGLGLISGAASNAAGYFTWNNFWKSHSELNPDIATLTSNTVLQEKTAEGEKGKTVSRNLNLTKGDILKISISKEKNFDLQTIDVTRALTVPQSSWLEPERACNGVSVGKSWCNKELGEKCPGTVEQISGKDQEAVQPASP